MVCVAVGEEDEPEVLKGYTRLFHRRYDRTLPPRNTRIDQDCAVLPDQVCP